MGKVHLRVANGQIVRVYNEHGKMQTYHAGDWFPITNKQKARELVELGLAILPGAEDAQKEIVGDFSDAGILVRKGKADDVRHILAKYSDLQVAEGDCPAIPFERTLILDTAFPMLPERAALGLARVEKAGGQIAWEAAAMLKGHNHLAKNEGSKEDKAGTQELFGDLRLPVYSTEAIWLRKTRNTEAFVRAWAEHLENGVGECHALIRALYVHRVVLCTLPVGWLAAWLG